MRGRFSRLATSYSEPPIRRDGDERDEQQRPDPDTDALAGAVEAGHAPGDVATAVPGDREHDEQQDAATEAERLVPGVGAVLELVQADRGARAGQDRREDRGEADGAEQAEERGAPAHAAVAGTLAVAHRRQRPRPRARRSRRSCDRRPARGARRAGRPWRSRRGRSRAPRGAPPCARGGGRRLHRRRRPHHRRGRRCAWSGRGRRACRGRRSVARCSAARGRPCGRPRRAARCSSRSFALVAAVRSSAG